MPSGRHTGSRSHKDPECPCNYCKSRRRAAKAKLISAGVGGPSLATLGLSINADDGTLVTRHLPITAREKIEQWVAMRAVDPFITNVEVARQLKVSIRTLQRHISKAVEEGWLKFDGDPISRIDYEIVPKVLRNLNELLDQKDAKVTIETAKGTVFKTYQEAKGVSDTPKTILALKIEAPPEGMPMIMTGQIVGAGRVIEGEVSGEEEGTL